MTDIFNVFIEACDGTTLTGLLQYRSPDGYGFSEAPEFGLQLIMDAWDRRSQSGAGSVSAATEAEFKELFELYLGREVNVDEEGYLLEDGSTNLRVPRVKAEEFYKGRLHPYGGMGISNGIHFVQLAPQPAEFAQRTTEIIVSFEISEDDPAEDDEDKGPSARFTTEVSDPRYLEHLAKGTSFTTAFTGHLPFA
ncbi:hypothetical protein OG417_32955 [Actinoallomurus sp. NBC_01490]|jgi:hypothetical protein|uniref:hypothetical protein n=1 Tax=Actinoallomurus sp. NBC_01490 TaxID=2903557 RepID=UPI002E2F0AF9|nr:hypothetical protein [Actinoallomurus sp. NBC_01490]